MKFCAVNSQSDKASDWLPVPVSADSITHAASCYRQPACAFRQTLPVNPYLRLNPPVKAVL